MIYNPDYDRTWWRVMPDRTLIEAAATSGHELAIALGERLEAARGIEQELADVTSELADETARNDALREELDALRAEYETIRNLHEE